MATLDRYLQTKSELLAERRRDFAAQPDSAVTHLKASCHVAGNTGIRPVKMGDYTVITDSGPGLAGHALGPTSPEMLLGALASCLAHTYVLQAALHDIALDHVAIETRGSIDFADVVNPDNRKTIAMQEIAFVPTIETPEATERVSFLHAEVEKACVVLNTLRLASDVRRVD